MQDIIRAYQFDAKCAAFRGNTSFRGLAKEVAHCVENSIYEHFDRCGDSFGIRTLAVATGCARHVGLNDRLKIGIVDTVGADELVIGSGPTPLSGLNPLLFG